MKSTLKLLSILSLMAFFLALNIASAQEIKDLQIEVKILDSKALISYKIETELSQLTINLPENSKIIDCSSNYSISGNKLTLTSINAQLTLDYSTDEFIENNRYFTTNLQIPETEKLNVRLILPESATLDKSYPEASLTSDGKHIILNWNSQNVKDFPVFVTYSEKSEQWLWYALIVLIAVAAFSIILTIRKRKIKKVKTKKQKPEKKELHLLESESAVIKTLKQAKGELWQKQIQLKTGFSKAKLSRVIRDLEARGLVKRIPMGNTNKIRLK